MARLQPRPKSRQSTTSIGSSNQTQQLAPSRPSSQQQQQQYTFLAHPNGATSVTAAQWQAQTQQQNVMPMAQQQIEGMLPEQLQGQMMTQPTSFDADMGNARGHPLYYALSRAVMNRDSPIPQAASARDSPMPDAGSEAGVGSTRGGTNDNELRRLLRENELRSLEDIAQQFAKDEGTSKLEKLKQIFGMIWLSRNVKSIEGQTIPRVSVYNEYQYSCGDFRLPTLNPASFGKLVRIIFPKIATRRLGVRGMSKYHYVGLTLIEDKTRSDKPRISTPALPIETSTQSDVGKRAPSRHSLPTDHTVFGPSVPVQSQPMDASIRHAASATVYVPRISNALPADYQYEASLLPRPLKLPEQLDRLDAKAAEFELPDISPYLPPGTDPDAANALISVYRSHCLLAIDNFRYCKTDKFSESYRTLAGLLTVPGQKLLSSSAIAPWIRECDWRKYQAMTPMLNMILLTQVPQKATDHMRAVAHSLCEWIQVYFQNQPSHLVSAMMGPASVFVCVLERFCRVQNAATHIATIFEDQESRNALWADWVSYSSPLHVVQNSLAGHGHRRCRLILTKEMKFLLNPTTEHNLDGGYFAEDVQSDSAFLEREQQKPDRQNSGAHIATIYRFLLSIRERFPAATAKEVVSTIERFTSNALRNMTLGGATTISSWWKLKCFIDEASYWLAEMGGLFENDSEILVPQTPNLADGSLYDFSGFDAIDSRPATGRANDSVFDTEVPQTNTNGHANPNRPTSTVPATHGKLATRTSPRKHTSTLHDDSGIGLGMDDDFGIDHNKFAGFVAVNNNSDPLDVVVC